MDFNKMKEIIPSGTMGYFTTSVNNMPDIRGWQLQFIEDGKIYFCTSNQKNIHSQLDQNPACSFMCQVGPQAFRISGTAVFASEEETQKVYDRLSDDVKKMYPSVDANGFCAFYIEHGTVKYAIGFAPFESFEF